LPFPAGDLQTSIGRQEPAIERLVCDVVQVKLIHFGVCHAADSALPVSGVQATIRITEK
jgi:hypothetical protein